MEYKIKEPRKLVLKSQHILLPLYLPIASIHASHFHSDGIPIIVTVQELIFYVM